MLNICMLPQSRVNVPRNFNNTTNHINWYCSSNEHVEFYLYFCVYFKNLMVGYNDALARKSEQKIHPGKYQE